MAHNDNAKKIVRASPPLVALEVTEVRVRIGTVTPILGIAFHTDDLRIREGLCISLSEL